MIGLFTSWARSCAAASWRLPTGSATARTQWTFLDLSEREPRRDRDPVLLRVPVHLRARRGIWSVDGSRSSSSWSLPLGAVAGSARLSSISPLGNAAARLASVSTSVSEPIQGFEAPGFGFEPGFTPSRVRLPVSLVPTEASRSGRDSCHTRNRPGGERENQVKKIYVGNLPWGASERTSGILFHGGGGSFGGCDHRPRNRPLARLRLRGDGRGRR
jgi:hypothetical protein